MTDDDRIPESGEASRSPSDRAAGGLSAAEVAARVARGQVNRSQTSTTAEYGRIIARNVFTLFNALVAPAAVALFLLGDYRSAWAISAMAVVNAVTGLVQEWRAKSHLDKLAILTEPKACVRRDGMERTIDAGDVVLDDTILLAAGDAVAADGYVLAARYLEIDESLLTGESESVSKHVSDRLFSGGVCVAGDAAYRVDRVGNAAYAEQLSSQARRYRYAPSPIQRLLNHLIRILTAAAIALCLFQVGLWLWRGFPATDLWQMIAATVTSMVPQGLVLMATLTMVLGAVRMTIRGAAIQRLGAVEAMAAIDVLCMDKTGTLTTGLLSLDRVRVIAGDEHEVRSNLMYFAAASIDATNKSILAIRKALGAESNRTNMEVIDQIPFKSENRYSAVRMRIGAKEKTLALGAYEAFLPYMSQSESPSAEAAWRELVPMGLRLLLFAEALRGDGDKPFGGTLQGYELKPLAIVVLKDEIRSSVSEALWARLASDGLRFKVLSGDSAATVHSTTRELPFLRDTVILGDQVAAASDLPRLVEDNDLFARVTPQQKLAIVSSLQALGHSIGMIGDGINDLLTIKRSDLGIAMGAGGNATRTVAGIVLENNDFALLPILLREGRSIEQNLRAAAKLFLLKNVYTLVLIVFGLGVLGYAFPYLPQQVTLLNGLTIGGPAILLTLGRAPVTWSRRVGFLQDVGLFVLAAGFSISAIELVVWTRAVEAGDGVRMQRTLLLSTLILIGLGNVLIVAAGDRRLIAWVGVALPIYAATMYIPWLADFFVLNSLPIGHWLIVVIAAIMALVPCALASRLCVRPWRS